MVLLNATPGKRGYAVSYPTDEDLEKRTDEATAADTILYRENPDTGRWEGLVLAFKWAETSCPETGNSYVDKLCSDLWYLEKMDTPEAFISVVKAFEMPEDSAPKDWARPGTDPLGKLGLLKSN
jgi:formylmethanofuran dehydrogenase subunit E-like metal-binding protein